MNDNSLRFLIGVSDDGEEVYGNFYTTDGFISVGHSGSGHASFDEGAFVTYLIQHYSPGDVQFVMIDPKQVQLTPYDELPHLLQPVAYTANECKKVVSELLEEAEGRSALLEDAGIESFVDYNESTTDKLPSVVLLATEIADLMMIEADFYSNAFATLARSARKSGIYLYLATQRPSIDVLTEQMRSSIPGRIVFAVVSELDSITLLGEPGAEKITEVGRLLFAGGVDEEMRSVKAHYLTDQEVFAIVKEVKDSYA